MTQKDTPTPPPTPPSKEDLREDYRNDPDSFEEKWGTPPPDRQNDPSKN